MSSSSVLRWGDQSPGDVREARGRVLDAAQRCLADNGYLRVTMEAIAAEAKISRATLYRYFSSRNEVLSGVVVRDAERYLERIHPRVEAVPDLGSAILEFIASTLKAARSDPSIALMFTSDDALDTGGILAESSVELFEMVTDFFRPLFEQRADQLRVGVTVEDASEWILRTLLSLLTVRGPKRRSSTALDAYLSSYLLPVIVADDDQS